MSAEKPSMTVLHGQRVTAESLAALYERMTGKKPTPEQLAAAQAKLNSLPSKPA